MAGAGATGSTFDVHRRTIPIDLCAAGLGAIAVHGQPIAATALFGVALSTTSLDHGASRVIALRRIVERLALACIAGALIAPPLSRWVVGGLIASIACTLMRSVRDLLNARPNRAWRRGLATILVGRAHDVREAAQLLAGHPEHGVRPVATISPDGVPTVLPNGPLTELAALIVEHDAQHVLVVSPELGEETARIIGHSRPTGVRLSVAPPMASILTPGVEVVDVRGLPFITLAPRRAPAGISWTMKRVIDFVGAALGLLLVLPVLVVAAVAIAIDSGRPIFFRQKRVGRDGKLFDLWKLRSMVSNAETFLPELRTANEADGPYFKIENDPRVTRVGRWLRRFSIDELPQLLNVMRGEMSLVGPRPCLPSEMESDPEFFAWRLRYCPGITGMWQVAGRSWLPATEGQRMDLAYVEHWSLGLDFRILLRTVSAALRGDRRPPVNRAEVAPALSRVRYLGLVDGDDLMQSSVGCDVSIIVVTHESSNDIEACLESLRHVSDVASRELIIVDNASKDGTADLIAANYPEARLIRKRHRDGFATNVNIGSVAASGRHLLLLNPDTTMFDGTIDRLVEHLDAHPDVGVVGPRLVYPDGRHQPSARRFPTPLNSIVRRTPLRRVVGTTSGTARHLMSDVDLRDVCQVDWLLGAVIAVQREAFHDVGGFDERYRLYCEDIDLCWRLQDAGWKVEYLTTATVQHALGELTAKRFFTVRTVWHFRSMLRFVRLHGFAPQARAIPARTSARRPVRRLDLIERATVTVSESVA